MQWRRKNLWPLIALVYLHSLLDSERRWELYRVKWCVTVVKLNSRLSKFVPIKYPCDFYLLVLHCKYMPIFYTVSNICLSSIPFPRYNDLLVIKTSTIRKHGCGFLFAFHTNYGSILHHFRDKARYLSKIVICSYTLAFDAPVRRFPVGILPSRFVWKN